MTDEDLAALDRQLVASEARRTYLYDDATGRRITQGSTVVGHPTWGIGFNCDAIDFTEAAIDAQYAAVRTRTINEVFNALPWTQQLPVGPLRAVIDVAYNAGVHGLLGFHQMLAALERGDYETAAVDVTRSRLEPHRAARLAVLIRQGAGTRTIV